MFAKEYESLINEMIQYLNARTTFYYSLFTNYRDLHPFIVSRLDINYKYTEESFPDFESIIKWLANEINEHTSYHPMMEW